MSLQFPQEQHTPYINPMAKVAKLTTTQKNQLVGKTYKDGAMFNPVQDLNGAWVISETEVTQNVNPEVNWVNALALTEFLPKPIVYPTQNS